MLAFLRKRAELIPSRRIGPSETVGLEGRMEEEAKVRLKIAMASAF
jgi:hypothetical protein